MKFIPVNVPKLHGLEKKYINECIATNWISSEGKFVKLFEKNFAKYNKRKYGTAVSSGTAALEIAIKSLNLKKKFRSNYTCLFNYIYCSCSNKK